MENGEEYRKKVNWILIYILFLNLAVVILKAIFGFLANSLSMLADALHSTFDSLSNIIGLIFIKIASKPPDPGHPYGHKKYETFATIIIAGFIFLTCFEVVQSAINRLIEKTTPEINAITVFVMITVLVINIFVSRYEHRRGVELNSPILITDSMHTKSDIYASISVLLGFIFIKLGFPYVDSLIALFIVFLIGKVGYGIIKSSSGVLCDTSAIAPAEIEKVVKKIRGVESCHKIRTRGSKNEIFVDLHIELDPSTPFKDAHTISHKVQEELKRKFPNIHDIVVHLEPKRL